MNPEQYHAFTRQLQTNLENDSRVLGLVALGSMAEGSHLPDEWSDHDFFVIVQTGQQEFFRQHLDWLPDSDQIVYSYQETQYGLKVFYASGHLIEFAVFDPQEISLAKVNDYRVILDREGIEVSLQQIQQSSSRPTNTDHFLFGQLIAHIQVGVGRYLRGESLSGHIFIKHYALADTLELFAKHLGATEKSALDNLDPLRRFEQVYPDLGAELNTLMLQPVPQAALGLLAMVERELGGLPDFPVKAVDALRKYLGRYGF